ncbi:hypothetical protein D3C75_628210 [compost metagenome]
MLLSAKQISGTAYGQVTHGYFESGTKLSKLLNRLQAFLRNFCQHFIPLVGEIGIGNPVGTANPSAQLIQLGQSHFVGIMHNQRINVRNINPGLNNARADKHIILSIQEIKDGFLQLRL